MAVRGHRLRPADKLDADTMFSLMADVACQHEGRAINLDPHRAGVRDGVIKRELSAAFGKIPDRK